MINFNFYIARNLVTKFSKLRHYPRKDRHKIVKYKLYTVQVGDTAYSLAKRFFGKYREYHWTYICDLNGGRDPLSFVAGEVIKIPTVVVSETTKRLIKNKAKDATA